MQPDQPQNNPSPNPPPPKDLQAQENPSSTRTLQVATLNYGGILNNPFQFYSDELQQMLEGLGTCFKGLFTTYMPDYDPNKKFDWSMGNVDKLLRKGRYSPLFNKDAGLNSEKTKFVTRQQFEVNWDEAFSKLEIPFEYQETQKSTTRHFDLMVYHALLKFVYSPQKDTPLEDLVKSDPAKYIETYSPLYKMSYLNEKSKLQTFTISLEKSVKADILFLQEYSEIVEEYFKAHHEFEYAVDERKDSMIVVRKSSFKERKNPQQVLSEEFIKKLNLNRRAPLMVYDNYVMVCLHLSSKKQQNAVQRKEAEEVIVEIRKAYPHLHFIIAGDINGFLEQSEQLQAQGYNMFPIHEEDLTTIKKRTLMQGQFKKSNILVIESKDKIISTLPLSNGRTSYINLEKPSKESLIPSDAHPFDHFLVVAQLTTPV